MSEEQNLGDLEHFRSLSTSSEREAFLLDTFINQIKQIRTLERKPKQAFVENALPLYNAALKDDVAAVRSMAAALLVGLTPFVEGLSRFKAQGAFLKEAMRTEINPEIQMTIKTAYLHWDPIGFIADSMPRSLFHLPRIFRAA